MDKLSSSLHPRNLPTLHQTPHTHKPNPKAHFSNSLSFASPLFTSLETPPLSTSPLPSSSTNAPYSSFLDGFDEVKALGSVKVMHAQKIKLCNKWNSDSLAHSLITSYLEVGDFKSAAMVFFVGFSQNYIMWNYFLKEFESLGGDPGVVLDVFQELHYKGVIFDSRIVAMILKICSNVMDSWLGLEVHASLIKRGFESDLYVSCALMNFYGNCWSVESANQVFFEMPNRDELSWNEAILVNFKNERWVKALELFREMQFSYAKADVRTILKMLQASGKVGALSEGKQIHGYVLKQGLELNLAICNSLISMYSRNGKIKLAKKVFDSMEDHSSTSWNSIIFSYSALGYLNDAWNLFHKMETTGAKSDVITWNCLMSGHALHGSFKEVLKIFREMQMAGFRPNSSSITSILQAVTKLRRLNFGKEIHGYVLRNRLDYDVYVGTSLLDMYVKNDCLSSSQAIFDYMTNKNICAWNSLISGYSFKGQFDDAKRLLNLMKAEGIKPDLATWNGLVSGYSAWGKIKEALSVFNDIKISGLSPNVISWTALMSGCSQKANYRESFEIFVQMQQEGIKPNSTTMSTLLRTCGGLSLLQNGKELHCLTTKNGIIEDVYISTALVDMYSKSGDLKSAYKVFRKTKNKTVASWNCMIMGFAIHGLGRGAISLFDEMKEASIMPDAITFTALLSSCKNSGLVDEGWKYFDTMSKDYGIKPTIEHYSCMVDLLGRAGYLDEAWDLIQTMPLKPDTTVWGAFLGSCRIHRNTVFAEIAAKELFESEPYNSANYVMMMNLYAMSDRWDDVERIKELMADKGVKIRQVWSWIQIDHAVHVFAADKLHRDEGEIYFELHQLVVKMKEFGYVPDISCVHQNIDEAEKETILLSHTEKLAITYGLIKTKTSRPIRVIKNTRICSDCHNVAKLVSLVKKRDIFVRDGIRFHHFKAGKCSCNDYW